MEIFFKKTVEPFNTRFSGSRLIVFGKYSQFFAIKNYENCGKCIMIYTSRFKRLDLLVDVIII